MNTSINPSHNDLLVENEQLRFALEAAGIGTWDYNLVTGLVQWSGICKKLFGLPPDADVTAAILLAQVHPDDRERVALANAQALDPANTQEHNIIFRTLNEADVPCWVQARGKTIRDEQGQMIRFSGIVQEITQSVLAQQVLSQSEERYRYLSAQLDEQVRKRTQELEVSVRDLKRSNDNLQQFAYVASHDLQEPLRKIQSFSGILQQQFGSQLNEAGKDILVRMATAGERMSTLIRDLLAYSRIATRQQLFGLLSLEQVITKVLNTLDWAIEQRKAEIEVDSLPVIKGDETQLGQLFQNLISNALKFTPEGQTPRISISCSDCAVDELPPYVHPTSSAERFYVISVSDQGVGFDTKYLDRIFQVFQRLHGRSDYPGTGVGLAICQRVVENHGGAITAVSQPGQGATFQVYLPA
ncbi:ATP-binding protein [Larkinella sp. VNQ87]|uniref:ATP-binding protein n=1 Tax=Larkinella sp. VNQ87 TaxID=3400921 RepID=UPI003BFC9740